jgi:hypothetical protein
LHWVAFEFGDFLRADRLLCCLSFSFAIWTQLNEEFGRNSPEITSRQLFLLLHKTAQTVAL